MSKTPYFQSSGRSAARTCLVATCGHLQVQLQCPKSLEEEPYVWEQPAARNITMSALHTASLCIQHCAGHLRWQKM